jgi:hypothetical protein
MNHKRRLNGWVNELMQEWVDKRGEAILHPSVQPLITKLRGYSLDEKHFGDAWHCIEQIEKLYDQIHKENYKTSARMFLECGVAAYRMGDAHTAISFLTRAVSSFTEDHSKGVACWLLGCAYWYVNNPISALAFWEDGFRHFKEEQTKSGRGSNLEQWYTNKIEQMESAIRYAAEHEEPPVVANAKGSGSTKKHILQTFPVIGTIPAGTPLNILPESADSMSIEQVQINNKNHKIISLLRGEKIVRLSQRQFYYLLRVAGKSMNKCSPEPIEDGDYVILREQYIADNGDIVAAIILKSNGEDPQATLKRYVVRDWKIFLLPESDDPEFQKPVYSQSFSNPNDEFQIRGVAVAVLKPL